MKGVNFFIMKKTKILGVILSFALLCSSLAFPFSATAETNETAEQDNAISALKTAWTDMYNYANGGEFMYPNAILANSKWYPSTDTASESDDTLLKSDDEYLGSYYAKIDTQKYTTATRWLGYGDSKHGSADSPFCNKYITSSVYNSKDGFYLYINAENVTSDVTLSLGLDFMNKVEPDKTYIIKSGSNGNIKVTDKDFFNDFKASAAKSDNGKGNIPSIWIKMETSGSAILKFGSLKWTDKVTRNLTGMPDFSEMSNNDVLLAAMKLHTANIYDAEYAAAFNSALESAKKTFDAETVATLEKTADWDDYETQTMQWATFRNDSNSSIANAAGTYTDVVTVDDSNSDRKLGSRFITLDTSKIKSDNSDYLVMADQSKWSLIGDDVINSTTGETSKKGNHRDGFYFYVKVNSAVQEDVILTCNSGWVWQTKYTELYYTIPAGTKAGTYIKITDKDLFTEGYKTIKNTNDSAAIDSDHIRVFFTKAGNANISIGSVFIFKRPTVDENGRMTLSTTGWQIGDNYTTKFEVSKNTDYVLTYRYKLTAADDNNYTWSGPAIKTDSFLSSNLTVSNSDSKKTEDVNNKWEGIQWIAGIHTQLDKWVNVAVKFNSGSNEQIDFALAFQGNNCNYVFDYFKLEEKASVNAGDVNGVKGTDICDLVSLNDFIANPDNEIDYAAAAVLSDAEQITAEDSLATLRSILLK